MGPWIEIAAIAAIALAAGFIHSAIGFGFGIVAIALVPMVIDVKTAHVVVSLSSVPMLMMAAWAYRHGCERRSLLEALVGSAILLPVGFFLFENSPMDWLVRGTGLAILCMVVWNLRDQHHQESEAKSSGSCLLAGGIAGFLAGAVSIAGPPIATFALKQNWPQTQFKSFVTQCLLLIAVYKTVILFARGFVVDGVAIQSIAAAVASVVGVHFGAQLSARIPASSFKRLVAIALVLVSLWMMFS